MIEHEHYGDVRDILVRLPHGDPYGGMSYVRADLFTVRHKLIRALEPAPTSVFEFGALVGYFLVTALDAAPSIERVGWVDNESHSPGSNAMCLENLGHWFGTGRSYRYETSRDLFMEGFARWRASGDPYFAGYDLVAVDSDHSYEGALADLRAAHALNPHWIFIDDWTAGSHGDDIHAAVDTFLEETSIATPNMLGIPGTRAHVYSLAEYVTVNGLAVLTRKDWA